MPQFDIPSDVKQKKLLKACEKEGLKINVSAGKGSHAKVFNNDGNFIIIQRKLYKQAIQRILKKLQDWNINIEKVIKNLVLLLKSTVTPNG